LIVLAGSISNFLFPYNLSETHTHTAQSSSFHSMEEAVHFLMSSGRPSVTSKVSLHNSALS